MMSFWPTHRCEEEKLTLRAPGFSSLVCKVFIAARLLLCFSFVCPQHVYCLYLWRCCAVNLEVAQDVLFWNWPDALCRTVVWLPARLDRLCGERKHGGVLKTQITRLNISTHLINHHTWLIYSIKHVSGRRGGPAPFMSHNKHCYEDGCKCNGKFSGQLTLRRLHMEEPKAGLPLKPAPVPKPSPLVHTLCVGCKYSDSNETSSIKLIEYFQYLGLNCAHIVYIP